MIHAAVRLLASETFPRRHLLPTCRRVGDPPEPDKWTDSRRPGRTNVGLISLSCRSLSCRRVSFGLLEYLELVASSDLALLHGHSGRPMWVGSRKSVGPAFRTRRTSCRLLFGGLSGRLPATRRTRPSLSSMFSVQGVHQFSTDWRALRQYGKLLALILAFTCILGHRPRFGGR